ncbi:unnamed protein product [Caenorhabditis angaria]|uniref:ShKT domain-containing protein n=1 Tax=Caenorhabditis angaria TaxID=860376 RepID=A0A9P1J1S3_9PELO|nr:unnamed protein product [Caenorhabditis angaria]
MSAFPTSICLIIVAFIVFSESCSDSSTACSSWKANGYCTNSFYTDSERQSYCAATCGYCTISSTTGSSVGCTDAYSGCLVWKKNGFCSNSFYNQTIRVQYCQQTCALCSVSSDSTTEATTAAADDTTTA